MRGKSNSGSLGVLELDLFLFPHICDANLGVLKHWYERVTQWLSSLFSIFLQQSRFQMRLRSVKPPLREEIIPQTSIFIIHGFYITYRYTLCICQVAFKSVSTDFSMAPSYKFTKRGNPSYLIVTSANYNTLYFIHTIEVESIHTYNILDIRIDAYPTLLQADIQKTY